MSEATQDLIGKLLKDTAQRDAIHIAVAPVVAARSLVPGSRVGLTESGEADNLMGKDIGIVDPFLEAPVKRGQRFFLFLFPNTITGLRHEWLHPAFEGDTRSESEIYLRSFAERLFSYYGNDEGEGSRFKLLMSQAEHGSFGTDIEYGDDCQPTAEFWDHFERYTGKKVVRHTHFRCAC